MMTTVPLEVLIQPRAEGLVEGAISFETGLTREQVSDPTLYGYDHHGKGFSSQDPGALTSFYQDVLMGRPMPQKFVARQLSVDTIVAITIFMHRDLITHPRLHNLVASVDFAHRFGLQGMAHLEDDVINLIIVITEMFWSTVQPLASSEREEAGRMKLCVEWVRDFVCQGSLTPEGRRIPQPQIKDVGSNGFVVAELQKNLGYGWIRLFQQGHLRGVLYSPEVAGKRFLIGARKSVYVPFDLKKAASILSEVETAAAGYSVWYGDDLWLFCPINGTVLKIEDIMEVLLRV